MDETKELLKQLSNINNKLDNIAMHQFELEGRIIAIYESIVDDSEEEDSE